MMSDVTGNCLLPSGGYKGTEREAVSQQSSQKLGIERFDLLKLHIVQKVKIGIV